MEELWLLAGYAIVLKSAMRDMDLAVDNVRSSQRLVIRDLPSDELCHPLLLAVLADIPVDDSYFLLQTYSQKTEGTLVP